MALLQVGEGELPLLRQPRFCSPGMNVGFREAGDAQTVGDVGEDRHEGWVVMGGEGLPLGPAWAASLPVVGEKK